MNNIDREFGVNKVKRRTSTRLVTNLGGRGGGFAAKRVEALPSEILIIAD